MTSSMLYPVTVNFDIANIADARSPYLSGSDIRRLHSPKGSATAYQIINSNCHTIELRLVITTTVMSNNWMTLCAGHGGLAISVEGAHRSDIKCDETNPKHYLLQFKPHEPGIYVCNIRFGDDHVTGMSAECKGDVEHKADIRKHSVDEHLYNLQEVPSCSTLEENPLDVFVRQL